MPSVAKEITWNWILLWFEHPIKAIAEIDGIPVEYKPLEECEKPKTITGYCSLRLEQTRQTIKRFS